MIVGERGSLIRLLWWQKRHVATFVIMGALVTVAHELLQWHWLRLPTLPLAVVGAALGIFVSFRTNSCYDRWWEGRKLWGRLINTSRHLCLQANAYVCDVDRGARDRIVRRHIAYVHTLRCLLRKQRPTDDERVTSRLTPAEIAIIEDHSNATAALLDMQLSDVRCLEGKGAVDGLQLHSIDESIRHLLDIQGGCERIKKTPLPRIYAFISGRMIQWFGMLFPCGLVADLGWGAIPISLLVTLGFHFISETGRVLEDPFTLFWNGLPLSDMSHTIETNLLEITGRHDAIPTAPDNPNDFVLM